MKLSITGLSEQKNHNMAKEKPSGIIFQAVNGVNPIQGSRLIFLLVAREEAAAFASAKKPLSGKESEIFNMYSEPYRD